MGALAVRVQSCGSKVSLRMHTKRWTLVMGHSGGAGPERSCGRGGLAFTQAQRSGLVTTTDAGVRLGRGARNAGSCHLQTPITCQGGV